MQNFGNNEDIKTHFLKHIANSNFYGYHIGHFNEGRLCNLIDYNMLRREYLNWRRVKSL